MVGKRSGVFGTLEVSFSKLLSRLLGAVKGWMRESGPTGCVRFFADTDADIL